MRRRDALALVSASLLAQNAPLEAGAAKRVITPSPLLPISGGMGIPKPATEKKGELYARALVLRQGPTVAALAVVDLIGFPAVLGNRVRALVPRLPAESILIGATHTHSAPDAYAFPDGQGGHTASLPYLDLVVRECAAALNAALDQLAPAELRAAHAPVEGKIAYNYYAPDLYDRRAGVLQLRRPNGPTIATLVNFAIHPEVLGNSRGILSPDLVGPLCDRLESTQGGEALFFNGAQGGMVTADNRDLSQAPRDPQRAYWNDLGTWAECERIGHLLASESARLLAAAPWQSNPKLALAHADLTLPVENELLWQVIQASPLKYPAQPNRSVTTRLHRLDLGSVQMLTIPGEALPNLGFYLKRKMRGPHPFLLGLTNDAFGYILSEIDFNSFPRYDYVSRTSLGEKTGPLFLQAALALLQPKN